MNNTISEMKNRLEGINSRLDEAENLISDLEVKGAQNFQISTRRKENAKK